RRCRPSKSACSNASAPSSANATSRRRTPERWSPSTPSSSAGVGKIYLQTAIDCASRYAWARLYSNKMPVTAVHLLNSDVLPTFEPHGATIDAVLSDNGREFCGREDQHPYELFLQLEVLAGAGDIAEVGGEVEQVSF